MNTGPTPYRFNPDAREVVNIAARFVEGMSDAECRRVLAHVLPLAPMWPEAERLPLIANLNPEALNAVTGLIDHVRVLKSEGHDA